MTTTISTLTTSSAPRGPSASSSSTHHAQPTTQACAACKYQRRRCLPDCTLAPYFPADQQPQFLNAHRLFGVSNIIKIIRGLDDRRRDEAMRSIIIQSNARALDPVGGCYRIILNLQNQIQLVSADLDLTLRQLAFYRAQAAAAADIGAGLLLADGSALTEEASYNPQYGFTPPPDLQPQPPPPQQQQYYNYLYFDGNNGGDQYNGGDTDQISNHQMNNNNSNGFDMNSHHQDQQDMNNHQQNNLGLYLEGSDSMFGLQPKCIGGDGEDVKPLVDIFEFRQVFSLGDEEVNSKEISESSKSEQKEEQNTMEHVQEHDLKGAASLFTLTNYHTSSIHRITMIEANENYVEPFTVNNTDIYPGQSYSVFLAADQISSLKHWISVGVRGRLPKTQPALVILNYLLNTPSKFPISRPPINPRWNDYNYSKYLPSKLIAQQGTPAPPTNPNRQIRAHLHMDMGIIFAEGIQFVRKILNESLARVITGKKLMRNYLL